MSEMQLLTWLYAMAKQTIRPQCFGKRCIQAISLGGIEKASSFHQREGGRRWRSRGLPPEKIFKTAPSRTSENTISEYCRTLLLSLIFCGLKKNWSSNLETKYEHATLTQGQNPELDFKVGAIAFSMREVS